MTCTTCASDRMREHGDYVECAACGYWTSRLPVDAESTSAPDAENEHVSYEHTRRENNARILDLLAKRHPRGARLLELGCADGLFLAMAQDRGYDAAGIEPNAKMEAGNPHHQDIRRGFFPDVLAPDERFDIIALNCVFEHVPQAGAMLDAFALHLDPDGSVMLNVPVSSGLMFKVARGMYRVGMRYPFDRIWQKGFVSPHVHYFAKDNLARLLAQHGFALIGETDLALFSLGGINRRLALDPNIRAAQRLTTLAALYLYYPVSRILPDARAFVFARGAA
jgi:SAM-dependent methyltransferase